MYAYSYYKIMDLIIMQEISQTGDDSILASGSNIALLVFQASLEDLENSGTVDDGTKQEAIPELKYPENRVVHTRTTTYGSRKWPKLTNSVCLIDLTCVKINGECGLNFMVS